MGLFFSSTDIADEEVILGLKYKTRSAEAQGSPLASATHVCLLRPSVRLCPMGKPKCTVQPSSLITITGNKRDKRRKKTVYLQFRCLCPFVKYGNGYIAGIVLEKIMYSFFVSSVFQHPTKITHYKFIFRERNS